MDVKSSIKGSGVHLDLGFDDILGDLNFAIAGHLEASKGDWAFWLDENLALMSGDDSEGTMDLDWETVISMTEFAAARRVLDTPLGDHEYRALCVEAVGGGRYIYLSQEIDIDEAGSPKVRFDESQDWLDPFVGARATLQLSERWSVAARADVGGFGIGSASDFTWHARAGVQYKPWERTALRFGYSILDIDYEKHDFVFDGRLYGPYLAFIKWF